MTESWIILGGSSSIAKAFAEVVAKQGAEVVLVGRDQDDLEASTSDLKIRYQISATVIIFDAMKLENYSALVQECWQKSSGTRNLFIALGYLPDQSQAERKPGLVERTIQINFTAIAKILLQFTEYFSEQRAGYIAIIGSVAGDRGRKSNYVYGSAKAGLHAFIQGFQAKLSDANVSVSLIKPGFIDTAMTYGLPKVVLAASPYAMAKACLRKIKQGKSVIYFPWFWRYIMLVVVHMPVAIFKRVRA